MESDELGSLVERLSNSGQADTLDASDLTRFKKVCREGGDGAIERAYRILMYQLAKKHSQVRLATLLLIDELFMRSHLFRTLVLTEAGFQNFLDLTSGINEDKKLPPPKDSARQLKRKAVEVMHKWYSKFASGYLVLKSAYEYLEKERLINFAERESRNASERARAEAEERRKEAVLKSKLDAAIKELRELEKFVDDVLTQMSGCFELLYPSFAGDGEISTQPVNHSQLVQEHALSTHLNLDINIPSALITIQKNDDTEPVIDSMKDLYKQLAYEHLPRLKKVMELLPKSSEGLSELKKAIDLKMRAVNSISKFAELKIIERNENTLKESSCESSSSDDDFEEVSENDDELLLLAQNKKESSLDEDVPSAPSTSSGVTPNARPCNAAFRSGKLCPRRDKLKCPFHGIIVERDATGAPIHEEDKVHDARRKAKEIPEWQDPAYLKELEAQIGIDLTLPSIKRKKRKKYPGLKELRTSAENSRKRLEKRIFSKDGRQKVINDMEEADSMKFHKFEDNWNYSMNS